MESNLSCKIVKITVVLLLAVVGPFVMRVSSAQQADAEKTDRVVVGNLNSIETKLSVAYQTVYEMLQAANADRRAALEEREAVSGQKLRAAQKEIDAKRQEIEANTRAAEDAWVAAMASCHVVAGGVIAVASTGGSVQALYRAPNEQGLRRFSTDADALKKGLTQLNADLNRIHDTLSSGKIDKVGKDNLEKMILTPPFLGGFAGLLFLCPLGTSPHTSADGGCQR